MSNLMWLALGIVFGLIPFALIIYFLMRPGLWWPRR